MESKLNWNDEKIEEVVRWVSIAMEDRKSAYAVFQEGLLKKMVYDLQQASEKLLKAFLVANDEKVEKTHNIDALMLSAVFFDHGLARFKKIGSGTSRMTEFATQYRYPNMSKKDFLEPLEAIAAVEFTDTLYEHLKPFFGEKILEMAIDHSGMKTNPFESDSNSDEDKLCYSDSSRPKA